MTAEGVDASRKHVLLRIPLYWHALALLVLSAATQAAVQDIRAFIALFIETYYQQIAESFRKHDRNYVENATAIGFVVGIFMTAVTSTGAAEAVVPLPPREVLDVSLAPPVIITAPGPEYRDEARPETNVRTHREAARVVAAEWRGEIVWHGFEIGNRVITGAGLQQTPKDNPVRRAYQLKPFGKPAH